MLTVTQFACFIMSQKAKWWLMLFPIACTFQIYSADTGQCLYSLQDDDISKFHLPVTSIHFKPYEDSDKIEHKSILIATCKTFAYQRV